MHFDDNDRGLPPAAPVSLGRNEFLVTSGGDVLATHDHKRLVLRDFERGSALGTLPVPRKLAASAISADGSVIVLATGSSWRVSMTPAPWSYRAFTDPPLAPVFPGSRQRQAACRR
ncbi:hypothetical protein [Streptomyces sp. MNU89]|uniref:hypothetical protein n=1 Tax=Streptomyces sp. MNU89 TaxID=2560025 RepID=UPI001E360ECF|nr:hypothetical protein [Streptomyces sp. MNU89]MCC9741312.1 hypothetical protein [Streptomyces sp. MNU89]